MSGVPPERLEYLACRFNSAHRDMGTELLSVDERGVTLRLGWRPDLTGSEGGLSDLVVTVVVDHACALAALVHIGDEQRMGATVDLRVDHLAPALPGRSVSAVAQALPTDGGSASVRVLCRAFDSADPGALLAVATSTVSVAP